MRIAVSRQQDRVSSVFDVAVQPAGGHPNNRTNKNVFEKIMVIAVSENIARLYGTLN